MAEGWARALADSSWVIQSAGIEAHGKNARAIAVMGEAGLDISGQESTKLTDDMISQADVVVTVCGNAEQNCPVLPAGTYQEHWPLDDPAGAAGTEDEIMAVFRNSRDDIRQRVAELLERLQG